MKSTSSCLLQIIGIISANKSVPLRYTSLLTTTILTTRYESIAQHYLVPLEGCLRDGSGVKSSASTALGMTEMSEGGVNLALIIVLVLLK